MDTEQLLQSAIAAARGGDRAQARRILAEIIKTTPDHDEAWLWLAGVIDDPARQRWCLEQVLARNPNHQKARQAMIWLDQQQLPPPPAPEPSRPDPEPARESVSPAPSRLSLLRGIPPASGQVQEIAQKPAVQNESVSPALSRLSQLAARMPPETAPERQVIARSRPLHAPHPPPPSPDEVALSLRCPFCGEQTTMKQRVCATCKNRLMEPIPSRYGNTPSLSMLGGMWGAGGVFTLAIGYSLLDRSNTFFFPFILGVVMLGMAVAVMRRYRWAYLAIGFALIPLGFFSWKYLFWPLLIPLVLAYTRSYRDFYPPTRRMVPRLVQGDHEEHHKAASFYQDLEMWYLAAQEWQAALQEQPANMTYRRGLARAFLELRQLEQAALEYQKVLMGQPDDESIRNILQTIEQKIREQREQQGEQAYQSGRS